MLFNTFLGLKLKRILTQLTIFIAVIAIFFLIIQTKNDKKDNKIANPEIIYEKNEFNDKLVKKRVKQSAPSLLIKVKSGDTLEKILKKAGFKNEEIFKVINETKKIFDPKNLIIGNEITIKYQNKGKSIEKSINSIFIPLEFNKNFYLEKINENFVAKFQSEKTQKRLIKKNGFITDSLYLSGLRSGINKKAINEMIAIFSFSVDFQRDIWRNDKFEILYEEEFIKYDKSNKNLGKILYANIDLQSLGSLKLYRFESESGKVEYFDENGKSAKKLLMKTPIDGARLSSGFGMRKHPILGYNVQHRGVDFAAPKGTPIYAAGDGVIEKKGWNGAYGKYIRIRHANNFKTAYAHLSKFNKTPGGRVKQGSIIGYVGSTGRSTGPHLHYEILKNGKRINPQKLKLPSGRKLKNGELERFIEEKNLIHRKIDDLGLY
ncbi:MAG: Murein DD-endopeptidase MepM [Alphaproteobacteria bacterium MarineAlpha6_Bin6]|nr:peptidase M23 [Pelagibacteraceae bacterium]PPR31058.1 MAG: Murein DD-endopeptidase MepM [Alphaproteobacteria bacterium MarineAlpha6_Bin6]PPR32830.1 MAG: Murein DD-endopeptidase MepM [Alphaproteobacteria bacterium MarineAlpha6_Bin5]|tara:strand:+ start:1604 stop:2902 length:1299 start_codon:yes stop_codon:yes gene_type:complete